MKRHALSADDATFKAGSQVFVDVVIKKVDPSNTDPDLPVWPENTCSWGTIRKKIIEVFDEKGKPVKKTKYGSTQAGEDSEINVIEAAESKLSPGKSVTVRLDIGKTFDLSHPGKYTVQLFVFSPVDPALKGENKVTVTVTP